MTSYERSDLLHIMKINRFTLTEADTAQLSFQGPIKHADYTVTLLVMEDLPSVVIKRAGAMIHSETVRSIDDLKIFLEERLYRYLSSRLMNRLSRQK